jgi:AcrR family transcriptional regulator
VLPPVANTPGSPGAGWHFSTAFSRKSKQVPKRFWSILNSTSYRKINSFKSLRQDIQKCWRKEKYALDLKQLFDMIIADCCLKLVFEREAMSVLDDPQRRLLDAAGQVFAEQGLKGATVREICTRAGVNIAAVNYYFRDKKRLYIEAVKNACGAVGHLKQLDWPPGTPPAVRLRDFIHVLVARMLNPDRPAWTTQLMMRELAQPTSACAEFVEEYVRPVSEKLQGILAEVLPPETPRWKRFLVGISIVGQCLHHVQNKPVVQLLVGDDYGRLGAEAVADHVTEFTLAALGLGEPVGDRS